MTILPPSTPARSCCVWIRWMKILYFLLMRLHRLNHDHAGAIRVYQTARETLERELGISPGPNLQQAYEQIQKTETVESDLIKAAGPHQIQSLIGRQAEWQRLRAAWQRAANGSAGIVIISGEAGIGKSRLAEEMILWADQQGIITARARAYGVEGQLTLGAGYRMAARCPFSSSHWYARTHLVDRSLSSPSGTAFKRTQTAETRTHYRVWTAPAIFRSPGSCHSLTKTSHSASDG